MSRFGNRWRNIEKVKRKPIVMKVPVPSEEQAQIAICTYLKYKHPEVIFTSEASGVRVTMNTAKRLKQMRSGSKLPDLIILEPRGNYHGLCIELKREDVQIVRKNGNYSSKHIKEQAAVLERLRNKGYAAAFAKGAEEGILLIDKYLNYGEI